MQFDENLPGYAYGEDLDFTSRFVSFARSIGRSAILDPSNEVDHLVADAQGEWTPAARPSKMSFTDTTCYGIFFPKRRFYRLFLVWSDVVVALRRITVGQDARVLLQAHEAALRSAGAVSRSIAKR
jgi:hypothetical protein